MVSTLPGHAEYNHTFPYEGTSYMTTASIHPTKDRDASGYIFSSTWYFEGENSFDNYVIQGTVVGDWRLFSFECAYGGQTVQGTAELQVRDEYVVVECPLPPWTRQIFAVGSRKTRDTVLRTLRETDISIDVWVTLDPERYGADVLERVPVSPLRPRADGRLEMLFIRQQIDDWETPMRETHLSICTAPLHFDGSMSLTDVLEWRVFHLYQGVDVVHWYSRTPEFATWVAAANAALGIEDTYIDAPVLSRRISTNYIYSDQALWMDDCMQRYGFADTWQAFIDLDEYLFPLDQPQPGATVARLDRLSSDVGSLKVYQVYYGGGKVDNLPSVPGLARFPRNAWSHWQPNYILAGARYTKGIYRPDAIRTMWVHSSITMGTGWGLVHEDVQTDRPGLLQLLHSRERLYEGLNFTEKVNITHGLRHSWETMADTMRGLDHLHSLTVGPV
ncbi:hypothetical protein JCM24511_10176 [Saitozyma sp. JCM 24511]|nr:hypothetical protein JCM24511_10176 [Saitozyma sp. JCM 24511]